VEHTHPQSADRTRAQISSAQSTPDAFRAALLRVLPADRDGWLDRVLGIDLLPDDGPELPPGCVPYLPCPVDALLRMVDQAEVRATDVFVDVGSGVGRAAALVHLLTGAEAIGLEVQPALVEASKALARRLNLSRLSWVEGDALAGVISAGSVFFLYCPFSGERLERLLAQLEPLARRSEIRVCCVDLPLPPCDWLTLVSPPAGDLAVYRSALRGDGSA
jgi:SAM-dependent methyltransferase